MAYISKLTLGVLRLHDKIVKDTKYFDMEISVIILSYNTSQITNECLVLLKKAVKEFKQKLKREVEVIVLDNASADGSAEMIAKKHPWVKLMRSDINLGFAKGNNYAMRRASGNYFLLLNSDAYVDKNTLIKARKYMSENECDVLACRLNFKNGNLQPSAGSLPNPLNITTWMLGIANLPLIRYLVPPVHANYKGYFAKDRNIGWAMGAFMFLKKEVYTKTKGFDENFFMYTEEVEWYKRIHGYGFKVVYTPRFSIVHLDKSSSGGDNTKAIILEKTGLIYYANKHFPNCKSFIKIIVYIGSLWRMIVFLLLGKKNLFLAHKSVLQKI